MLGPPYLLETESREAYEALTEQLALAIQPRDFLEELWVRDIADQVWEGVRLKRIRHNLRKAAAANRSQAVMQELSNEQFELYSEFAKAAYAQIEGGAEVDLEKFSKLEGLGLDVDSIEAAAFIARFDDFDNLERMILQTDARRAATLREIDRHREAKVRQVATEGFAGSKIVESG